MGSDLSTFYGIVEDNTQDFFLMTQMKKTRTSTTVHSKRKHSPVTLLVFLLTFFVSVVWFMIPPTVTEGETVPSPSPTSSPSRQGKYVVIYLQKMYLELRDGDTVLRTLPLLSKGKPGSYYETIGGAYVNDYKTPLHFSSIGHVYMPYSVHLFGNYFIHGIPYYPNGDPVSSTYSGGCIRLTNENAARVYDFIEPGTPIIATDDTDTTFSPTKQATTTLESIEMTNLMIASISLEFLTQDNQITDTNGVTPTTRKTLLPRLINDNDASVAHLYAKSMGNDIFVTVMNDKAKAIGLTNTFFTDIDSPVITSFEDYTRFMNYITTYKSYLRSLSATSSPL
jgi:hypothetical protein